MLEDQLLPPFNVQSFGYGRNESELSLLSGYKSTITDQRGKERYLDKLSIIHGVDPYKIPKSEWIDDVDLWPGVTYIHTRRDVSAPRSKSVLKRRPVELQEPC